MYLALELLESMYLGLELYEVRLKLLATASADRRIKSHIPDALYCVCPTNIISVKH